MIVLGLLLGLIGTDVTSGVQRYTFGLPQLADGVGFVVVAMGIFGVGQVIGNLEMEDRREVVTGSVSGLLPTREDWQRMVPPTLRGNAVGANDDGIDLAARHQMAGHVVGDERHRYAFLHHFPCRQTRALQEGAGLVGDHADLLASRDRRADDAECSAVSCRG